MPKQKRDYKLLVDLYQYAAGAKVRDIGGGTWSVAGDWLNAHGGIRDVQLAKLLDFMRDQGLTELLEPIK